MIEATAAGGEVVDIKAEVVVSFMKLPKILMKYLKQCLKLTLCKGYGGYDDRNGYGGGGGGSSGGGYDRY